MKRNRSEQPPRSDGASHLPDLDHAKAAVLSTLGSSNAQRCYRFAIEDFMPGTVLSPAWVSTKPPFSATGWSLSPVTSPRPPSICDWPPCDDWPTKPLIPA